jgi:hypothetical protein
MSGNISVIRSTGSLVSRHSCETTKQLYALAVCGVAGRITIPSPREQATTRIKRTFIPNAINDKARFRLLYFGLSLFDRQNLGSNKIYIQVYKRVKTCFCLVNKALGLSSGTVSIRKTVEDAFDVLGAANKEKLLRCLKDRYGIDICLETPSNLDQINRAVIDLFGDSAAGLLMNLVYAEIEGEGVSLDHTI